MWSGRYAVSYLSKIPDRLSVSSCGACSDDCLTCELHARELWLAHLSMFFIYQSPVLAQHLPASRQRVPSYKNLPIFTLTSSRPFLSVLKTNFSWVSQVLANAKFSFSASVVSYSLVVDFMVILIAQTWHLETNDLLFNWLG